MKLHHVPFSFSLPLFLLHRFTKFHWFLPGVTIALASLMHLLVKAMRVCMMGVSALLHRLTKGLRFLHIRFPGPYS